MAPKRAREGPPRRLTITDLLVVEKQRRGLSADALVFVSVHDIAQYWWCPMYAVRKSRHREIGLFRAYLSDRINYAQQLQLIDRQPRRGTDHPLRIGQDITLAQVESLFAAQLSARVQQARGTVPVPQESIDSAYSLGRRAEANFAEVYGTFRWNFPWKEFTLVGVPDGLTENFVYEFKATKRRRGLDRTMRTANTQADLYGLFFERPRKRVQVFVTEDEQVETCDGAIDRGNALLTLDRVRAIALGQLPEPPEAFKCRTCDLADGCPVRQM